MNTEFKPPKRRRVEEDVEQEDNEQQPFSVMATPLATQYRVHIDETFKTPRQFRDLVQTLDQARKGDVVEIKLSTDGGALHAVLPLIAAIANTEAVVFVHAVSDVASAGTFLLMMAHDVFINPYVTVMFHQVSFGAFGQGNHVNDRVSHVMESSSNLLRDMYRDFFSEDELQQMLGGKEFWLTKEQFDARYAMRREKHAKMMEEMQAAQAQAEAAPQKPPRSRRPRKGADAAE